MIAKTLKKNKINVDKRGKITTGIKTVNEKGIEYPRATDYFVIDDFPELVSVYGSKPKKLLIVFPSDDIEDFFQAKYTLYGANNQMIRMCDGEECIHRIKETVYLIGEYDELNNVHTVEGYERTFEAGEITECICRLMPFTITKDKQEVKNPKKCNISMNMKAFIVDYKEKTIISPTCYMFQSGSENTASNIYSELVRIKNLFGRISGLPFVLSVDMISSKMNPKNRYPLWNLQIIGTVQQIESAILKSDSLKNTLQITLQKALPNVKET